MVKKSTAAFSKALFLVPILLTCFLLCSITACAQENAISLNKPYTSTNTASGSYPDSGNSELTDGILGTESFKDTAWQGHQFVNEYSQVFDLQEDSYITSVSCRFLESAGSAIYFPASVTFYCSSDGTTYTQMGNSQVQNITSKIASYGITLPNALRTRYIKMTVVSNGEWIFSDEFYAAGISDSPRNIAQTKAYETSVQADDSYPDTNMWELTDGVYGTSNFRDAAWQGHLGNYSVTVDLGTVMRTTSVKLNFLEYIAGGVSLPASVNCYTSEDNTTFSSAGVAQPQTSGEPMKAYKLVLPTPQNIRYIRFEVTATTPNDWIFQDEISVIGYPIVSGSFIQLSYGDIWTLSDWTRELTEMKDLGMDHVILQWIVDRSPSEPAVYFTSPTYTPTSGYPNRNGDDTLMNVLTAAESLDMDVWVGLAANEQWWKKSTDSAWLTAEAAANNAIIKEIWDSPLGYKNKTSFKGWYNVWEIENNTFKLRADQTKLRTALKTIVDYAHSYTGKPIMTSPYIGGYSTGLQPSGWKDMWIYLLDSAQGATFDVIAPQDSFGNITETYIKAMKEAVDTNPACELWSNVETYLNPNVYAEPTITLMKQINEEIKYVRKMTSFSYLHYSSSSVVGWAESEDWKRVILPRLGREYTNPIMGYQNKAAGKHYTASVAANNASPDDGGTELTNKKYAGAVNYLQGPYQARFNVPTYEFVVDMQKPATFSSLLLSFIKQGECNVDFPQQVSYFSSTDGTNYTLLGTVSAPVINRVAYASKFRLDIPEDTTARYVKAVVTTGSSNWTACDEFEIIGKFEG